MRRDRNKVTRLAVEQLESRTMLSGDGLPNSAGLDGGGLPGNDLGRSVSPIAPGGYTGAPNPGYSTINAALINQAVDHPGPGYASSSADATTGVGQMLITNGANTPGIGSFASATNGFATSNSTGSG